jgi:hypothetical protein
VSKRRPIGTCGRNCRIPSRRELSNGGFERQCISTRLPFDFPRGFHDLRLARLSDSNASGVLANTDPESPDPLQFVDAEAEHVDRGSGSLA